MPREILPKFTYQLFHPVNMAKTLWVWGKNCLSEIIVASR